MRPRRMCAAGKRLACALALLCLAGCATPAFEQARALHHSGDSPAGLAYLNEAEPDIPDRDRLLLLLERGMLELYSGMYEEASSSFVAAVDYIDDQDTISVREQTQALLINDATKRYKGETSEQLLAHSYAMLGFLLAGKAESAAVEARRATDRLAVENDELVAAYFTRALIALSFEMAGQYNDAYVAVRSLPTGSMPATRNRLAQYLGSGEPPAAVPPELQNSIDQSIGELALVVSTGQVSRKYSSHLHNGIDWSIAFPAYPPYTPQPTAVTFSFDSGFATQAESAQSNIDALARTALQGRAGKLLLSQGTRLAVKSSLVDELQSKDDVAAQLLAFALMVSEVADTRGWYGLPAQIGLWRVPIPSDANSLTVTANGAQKVIDLSGLTFGNRPVIKLLKF